MDTHRNALYAPVLSFLLLGISGAQILASATVGSVGSLAALETFGAVATLGALGVLSGCRTAEPAFLRADDGTITSSIQAKLAADGDLKPFNIDVTTNQGVVTLKGRVKGADTRERAERYARETDGVKRVINLVKVGDQP
jgi:osmotically-inducible protein OsmY